MNKKLVLIDESTEDLLASIDELEEQSGEELILDIGKNKTYSFLQRLKIKPGKNKIARKDLYTLYSKSAIDPINIRKFFEQLALLLTIENGFALINKDLTSLVSEVKPQLKQPDIVSNLLMKRYEKFLQAHNITDGTDIYISEKALYYFFDKWTYENKIGTTGFYKFKRLTSLYLKNKKQLTNVISYGMDKSFYEKVNNEEIEKAKEWAKKYKPSGKN